MKLGRQPWLFSKMTVLSAVFIALISLTLLGTVYFWSYYYFGKIFEDHIIDDYTNRDNERRGVYDEWILGVTAHSIDLVEAIHGKETARHIEEEAKSQKESSQIYREKVDGKYLMYRINLDYKNGEKVYKYSIVKDIYKDIFPKLLMWFFIFVAIVLILSVLFTKLMTNKLYGKIRKLKDYIGQLPEQGYRDELVLETVDKDIAELAGTFSKMQRKLQEKDAAQQDMLQYISHELKTPLMIIRSYADSAKDGIYPKGSLEATLETIMKQAERMEGKVRDLLFISEMQKNRKAYEEEIRLVHLDVVAEEVIEHLQYRNEPRDISVDLPAPMQVFGYKHQLEILFENLIDNQFKYSNSEIGIRGIREEGACILYFCNDGKGIGPEMKDSLFRPFVKGEEGSHGLGLSICRQIARLHHGDIELVDSDEGTVFKVVIRDVTKG